MTKVGPGVAKIPLAAGIIAEGFWPIIPAIEELAAAILAATSDETAKLLWI